MLLAYSSGFGFEIKGKRAAESLLFVNKIIMTTIRSKARNKKERNLNSTDQNRKEHTILDSRINWLMLSKAARTYIFPTKILNVEFYLIVK